MQWRHARSWMDGRLAILHPFQQYFSHIRKIDGDNQGYVQGTHLQQKRSLTLARHEFGTPRSEAQCLTFRVTRAPTLVQKRHLQSST